MSVLRKLLLCIVSGMAATFLSSEIKGTAPGFCPNILELKPCELAAVGWPIPYAVDNPGISIVGKVSLSSALGGEDTFVASAWVENMAFWSLAFAILRNAAGRVKRLGSGR